MLVKCWMLDAWVGRQVGARGTGHRVGGDVSTRPRIAHIGSREGVEGRAGRAGVDVTCGGKAGCGGQGVWGREPLTARGC